MKLSYSCSLCKILLLSLIAVACGYSKTEKQISSLRSDLLSLDTITSSVSSITTYESSVEFLLKNIQYKYSSDHKGVYKVHQLIKQHHEEPQVLAEELSSIGYSTHKNIGLDIDSISPKFLSDNTYASLSAVANASYGNEVSQSVFNEYILPYRINSEPIEKWRELTKDEELDSVLYYEDLYSASTFLLNKLSDRKRDYKINYNYLPDLPYSALKKLSAGRCKELTDYTTFVLRAYGIPVATDFTPNYANAHSGHEWNAIVIDSTKSIPFIIPLEGDTLGKFKADHYVLPKIYRKTFSLQRNSHAWLNGVNDQQPGFLNDGFIIDVTDQYIPTTDIELPIKYDISDVEKLGYLYVFNDRDWVPVAWGTRKQDRIFFNKVGLTGYFLPADLKKTGFNDPFRIDENGEVQQFRADTSNLITLKVTRKYPLFPKFEYYINRMVGGEFQGSNTRDFNNPVTLYRIESSPGTYYNTIEVNDKNKYKYLRYRGPVDSYSNVAEIEFYDQNDRKLKGEVIATEGVNQEFPDRVKENVFDEDVLTIFQSVRPDSCWVGLALSKPASISKIRFLARNDYNIIVPGDEYEVFYWENGWISLGRKIAKDYELIYDNAPSNALYLIRNYTEGKQERIFTYENGHQKW